MPFVSVGLRSSRQGRIFTKRALFDASVMEAQAFFGPFDQTVHRNVREQKNIACGRFPKDKVVSTRALISVLPTSFSVPSSLLAAAAADRIGMADTADEAEHARQTDLLSLPLLLLVLLPWPI
jgi:hypothetical protein